MAESTEHPVEPPAGTSPRREAANSLVTRTSLAAAAFAALFGTFSRLDAFNGAMDGLGKLGSVFSFFKDLPRSLWWALLAGLVLVMLLAVYLELRRFQDRRAARRLAGTGGEPRPGYFRIGPYLDRPEDRAAFRRADEAHAEVLRWLEGAPALPVYLSGDSGAGKSSLLNAHVLPELRDRGWTLVGARAYRDPEAALREALAAGRARRPEDGKSLRDLAESAARKAPVLLLLDQFEEFLILAPPETQARFAALVANFAARPVKNLRLLLVLRSDYQRDLGKAGLPPPHYGHNLYEVGRFDFAAARGFMAGSGLGLDDSALDRLLESAALLDDTPGRIRPITLNVLGRILAEGRHSSAGLDAARLVRGYLGQTVEQPGLRESARPVLEQLLTEQGTKRPRAQGEIAATTGLEPYAVLAVLNGLGKAGLARPLDVPGGVWELSHDFVARALNAYLGRRPGELGRKTLAHAGPALLGALLAAVGVYELVVARPARAERQPILPELVDIPAGSFCLGSRKPGTPAPADCPELPEDPEAQGDETPARRVQVPAFRLGRHEVTAGEFRRFVSARKASGHEIDWADDAQSVEALPREQKDRKDRLPAVMVSHDEALAYAEWLWRETGRKGPKYRLPTEAEWEYAARAGTLTRRWWGDDPKHREACAHANVLDRKALPILKGRGYNITWEAHACEEDGYVYSAPVGRFGANGFGLHDMLGNVWEWVADCYHESYRGAPAGPEAWIDGMDCARGRRVIRGGSWFGGPAALRSATRYWNAPDFRYTALGFRLAQDSN